MSDTRVTADSMAAAATAFQDGNHKLQETLSSLMRQLSGLEGTWKGAGATAFTQVKHEYEANLKKLNDALADTAQMIDASNTAYSSTDAEAASRVSKTAGHFQLPL